jgi:formylglycine-generating enzyme required for sulfatase activity
MAEREEPKRSKPGDKAKQPLPRLWKEAASPPQEAQQAASDKPRKKPQNEAGSVPPKTSSKSKEAAAKKKAAKDWFDSRSPGKKVLVEDTPALDTYESRRKVRLMIGGLSVVSVFALGWITYRTFLYDPMPANISSDDPNLAGGSSEIRLNPDHEAQFIMRRAHDYAKGGRTDEAIAMLTRVVTVYKGTATASEAQAALERPKKNLPLFTDMPAVVAQPESPQPTPAPEAPTTVVKAEPASPPPAEGNAELVAPSNAAEAVVAAPSLRDRAAAAKTGITPRALPAGFKAQLDVGVHESGWPLMIMGDRDGAPMLLVPGGTFTMGGNDTQAESPPHQVQLSPYYIDQHEVANRQFRIFLGETQYRGQPAGKWLTDEKARAEPETMPVANVNFKDAEAYASWAGKQLPTEAQWEMAARGPDSRRYPWGDTPPPWAQPRLKGEAEKNGIKRDESPGGSRSRVSGQIDPIMTYPEDTSPYGVFDMAGNVQEWTKDWFAVGYFRQIAKSVAVNPAGPVPRTRAPQRVVKGGSKNFTLSHREGIPPERRVANLGFRCVLAVEGAAAGPPSASSPAPPPGAPPGNAPSVTNIPF